MASMTWASSIPRSTTWVRIIHSRGESSRILFMLCLCLPMTIVLSARVLGLMQPDRSKLTRQPHPTIPPPCNRSEEHTSELQSHSDLVCRLLLEKKKKFQTHTPKLDSHRKL